MGKLKIKEKRKKEREKNSETQIGDKMRIIPSHISVKITHRDYCINIERANMHSQGIKCASTFYKGLT